MVHAFSRCGESGFDLFRQDPATDPPDPDLDLDPNLGNSLGDMLMRLVRDESEDFLEMGRSSVEDLSLLL